MSYSIDVSQLRQLAAHLERAGADLPRIAQTRLMALSPQIEALGIEQIKAVTPRGDDKRGPISDYWAARETPRANVTLANSTMAETESNESGMVTHIAQPAVSEPDQAGRWGGILYGNIVRAGRGPVRPVFAKALSGRGFGPAAEAGPAKANDYVAAAVGSISLGLERIIQGFTEEVMTEAMH